MPGSDRILCYLNAEQIGSLRDLSRLAAFRGQATDLKVVGNVFDPSVNALKAIKGPYNRAVDKLSEAGAERLKALAIPLVSENNQQIIWTEDCAEWLDQQNEDLDLLAIYGKRSGAEYSLPGDWRLVRSMSRPVLVINPNHKNRTCSTILATIDIANPDQAELNQKVLEVASRRADIQGADLHVLAVIHLSQVVADLEFVDEARLAARFREKHATELYVLCEQFGVPQARVHMEIGVPHKVIRQTAKKIDPHCIVMGTEGRTGVARIFLGSTAEQVLMEAPQSVLIVPADRKRDSQSQ